jgi:hypothetical protein
MHIVTEGPIDPFHTGMLIRLARLLIPQCDPAVRAPTHKTIGEKFREWSSRIACGYWLEESNHPFGGNDVSESIANTSRTSSFRMLKVRNRRTTYRS